MKAVIIIFTVLFTAENSIAQDGRFMFPLQGSIRLSGNFCELRPDHFHSGIDFKTGGREGAPVYAADSGYIYRIKVSATGYGKALYILHAGNILTVYAHLNSFAGNVADTVRAKQYLQKSFETEYFPDSMLFPVRKGQLIGWSGNSGGSEGPHLHFEIRDQATEEPLNPLLNGLQIDDTIKPVVDGIAVYKASRGQYILCDTVAIDDEGVAVLNAPADTIALAFSAYDMMSDTAPSRLGIYKALILLGNDTLYSFAYNRMNFDWTRSVNAHLDYAAKYHSGIKYRRCFNLPGNEMAFNLPGLSGLVPLKDSVTLKLIVFDANGNSTLRNIRVRKHGRKYKLPGNALKYPNASHTFRSGDAELNVPYAAFYETVHGVGLEKIKLKNKERIYKIVPEGTAIRRQITLSIKVPSRWKANGEKTLVAVVNEKGTVLRSAGGIYKDGMVSTRLSSFGVYALEIDTTPPAVSVLQNYTDHVFNREYFRLKIKDNLSGISSYSCTVNGQWHLFEYDPRTGTLITDVASLPEKFILQAFVTDKCNNSTLFEKEIQF